MRVKLSLANVVRGMFMVLAVVALVATFMMQSGSAFAHSGNAYVRVVHAAPGAPVVDVYIDGSKLLNDFTFGSVTNYVAVPAGSHRIQIAPDGAGRGASVIDVTVWLNCGTYYTAAALGTKDSGFSLKAFVDNNWVPDGKAKIRVYHLSPNAGPVDVAVGGTKVISELAYKHASGYLAVNPGSYTFDVTAVNAGVTVPLSAKLDEGFVYSVFAVGLYKGSPGLQFVVAAFNSDAN